MSNIFIKRTKALVAMKKAQYESSLLKKENDDLRQLLSEIEGVCLNSIETKKIQGFGVIFSMIKMRCRI